MGVYLACRWLPLENERTVSIKSTRRGLGEVLRTRSLSSRRSEDGEGRSHDGEEGDGETHDYRRLSVVKGLSGCGRY